MAEEASAFYPPVAQGWWASQERALPDRLSLRPGRRPAPLSGVRQTVPAFAHAPAGRAETSAGR